MSFPTGKPLGLANVHSESQTAGLVKIKDPIRAFSMSGNRVNAFNQTGFPASGKIMETWKMEHTFSRPGKIMEFEKSPKDLEKSWNLKKSTWKNH